MGFKHNDTCLQKAKDDEPLFVLRAQDASAPKTVLLWLIENMHLFKTNPAKADEAYEQAKRMYLYSNRKASD